MFQPKQLRKGVTRFERCQRTNITSGYFIVSRIDFFLSLKKVIKDGGIGDLCSGDVERIPSIGIHQFFAFEIDIFI